jgi:hypothetical protein
LPNNLALSDINRLPLLFFEIGVSMRIFPPILVVGEDEGFSSADIFGRAHFGKGLTNLLARADDPMVIAVDGQWGTGKTIFLKMWAGELRRRDFPVVYFDAFQHDYSADAFTALAAEIVSLTEKMKSADKTATKKFLKNAVGASKVLLRSGMKIGVKVATAGALEYADFSDLAKDVGSEAGALADKYVGDLLTKRDEEKSTIEGFRKSLAELPAALSSSAGGAAEAKPLIFIIDELDRCRPTFALELLERVKHFFSVPDVHFVLGANLVELGNSVTAAYGSKIDAARYLERFIHVNFSLADTAEFKSERIVTKFVSHLVSAMDFAQEDRDTVQYATEIIRDVCHLRNLSLRTIERVMTILAVSLAFSDKGFFRPPPILGGLCILKVMEPHLFNKAKKGTLDYSDVSRALAFDVPADDQDKGRVEFYKKWWRFATDPNEDPDLNQTFHSSLMTYSIDDRRRIVPFVANGIVDRLVPRG